MIRYKLINEGCGQLLIDQLDKHLEAKEEKTNKGFHDERDQCPLQYFESAIYIIKKHQQCNLNDELNNYIADEYLTSTEAALLLNGLNPAAGSVIDSDIEGMPRGGDHCSYDILHDYLYDNNKEFRQLSKAAMAKDGFAFEEGSDILIYTEAFIPWAIKKGFIEEINDIDNQNPATEKYSTWQKNHNTVVVLMALEKRWEEDKSNDKENTKPSKLLQDESSNFYKSIKDKLAPRYKSSNELPTAKTLKNYISAHNSFKKSLNQE